MAEKYKSADTLIITPLGFNALGVIIGVGLAPIKLYGDTLPDGMVPLIVRDPLDVSVTIQNRSAFVVELGTTIAAPRRGDQLYPSNGRTWDVGGQWTGSIYVIVDDAVGLSAFAVTIMRQS